MIDGANFLVIDLFLSDILGFIYLIVLRNVRCMSHVSMFYSSIPVSRCPVQCPVHAFYLYNPRPSIRLSFNPILRIQSKRVVPQTPSAYQHTKRCSPRTTPSPHSRVPPRLSRTPSSAWHPPCYCSGFDSTPYRDVECGLTKTRSDWARGSSYGCGYSCA